MNKFLPAAVLIVLCVFLVSCTDSAKKQDNGQHVKQDNIQHVKLENEQHYQSPEHGYSISYPGGWTEKKVKGTVAIRAPKEANCSAAVIIQLDSKEMLDFYFSMTTKEAWDQYMDKTTVEELTEISIDGHRAQRILFISKAKNPTTIMVQYNIDGGDKVYTIMCPLKQDTEDANLKTKYISIFDAMANSFKTGKK